MELTLEWKFLPDLNLPGQGIYDVCAGTSLEIVPGIGFATFNFICHTAEEEAELRSVLGRCAEKMIEDKVILEDYLIERPTGSLNFHHDIFLEVFFRLTNGEPSHVTVLLTVYTILKSWGFNDPELFKMVEVSIIHYVLVSRQWLTEDQFLQISLNKILAA